MSSTSKAPRRFSRIDIRDHRPAIADVSTTSNKHRSPIWKQEQYADGDSEWSEACSLCESHDETRTYPANATVS